MKTFPADRYLTYLGMYCSYNNELIDSAGLTEKDWRNLLNTVTYGIINEQGHWLDVTDDILGKKYISHVFQ